MRPALSRASSHTLAAVSSASAAPSSAAVTCVAVGSSLAAQRRAGSFRGAFKSASRRPLWRLSSGSAAVGAMAAVAHLASPARAGLVGVRSSMTRAGQGQIRRIRHVSPSRRGAFGIAARAVATSDPESSSVAPLLPDALSWPSRDQTCGDLRDADVGRSVTLCGWVDKQRDMGGIVFADVRDHTGFVQVVSDKDTPQAATDALAAMRSEWVVRVAGRVKARTAPNDKIPTGLVEVAADEVTILNTVGKSLPFAVSGGDDEELREELRLKHRVLDLRRPQMVRNLRLRAKTIRALREVLEDEHGFLEVETPVLTRSTPEGARDYLVPSRLQPGACYALPQSPQLFKQMLMVAGADRYYQVARCFRDEDLRADRQPEFTQLDIEMAFTDMDGILNLGEDLMCAAFAKGAGVDLPRPFRRMTYAEAMSKYGSDKPDLRYGLEMAELAEVVKGTEFKLFAGAIEAGGVVKAIAVPDGKRISNSRIKPKGDIFAEAVAGGAGGLAFARVGEDGATLEGPKALCEGLAPMSAALISACGAGAGDLILFGAGAEATVNKALDRVRQYVAHSLGMVPEGEHAVLWITDFPMFEYNADEDRLEALHHPFTAPNQSDVADGGDIKTARAIAYDLVYNGVEVGGGSLRIYRRDVQEKVFDAIGLSKEEAEEKFGYLMEAFQFGAPPHGGMAFGLDRLVMMLCGAKSIRDVIAFPKTATAQCLLTSAPGDVSAEQLNDLHIAALPEAVTRNDDA